MALKVGELLATLGVDDQLTKALARAEGQTKTSGRAMDQALTVRATVDLSDAVRTLAVATDRFAAAGEKAGGGFTEGAKGGLGGIVDAIGGLKVPIIGAVAILGGLAGDAFVDAIGGVISRDMDASITAASVATDGHGGSAVAARFGRIAGQLYVDNFGASVKDNLDAIQAVVTTQDWEWNLGDDELRAAAEQALNFATIFDQDLPRALKTTGVAVSTGLAKDWTEAWDLMTRTMQLVPVDMRGDVMDAVDEYARFLSQMGFTGAEAFNTIRNAAQDQFTLDKSIDAIKEFQIRATDMSTTSVDAYKAIGLNAEQMSREISKQGPAARKAFGVILDRILAIKDPLAQRTAAVGLFGTQFEDLGNIDALKALRPMVDGFGQVAGAAAEAGRVATDNLGSALESIRRKLEPESLVDAFSKGGAAGLIGQLTDAKDEAVAVWDRYGPEAIAAFDQGKEALGTWWTETGAPWLSDKIKVFWEQKGPEFLAATRKWWTETGAPGVGSAISDTVGPAANAAFWGAMQSLFGAENVSGFRRGSDIIVADVLDPIGGALQGIGNWGIWLRDRLFDVFEVVGVLGEPLGWVIDRIEDIPGAIGNLGEPLGWLIDRLEDLARLTDILRDPAGAVKGLFGDIPGIPGFDTGGVVPGPTGRPRLIMAHGGETVLPTHRMPAGATTGANAGPSTVRSESHTWNVTGQSDPRSTAWHLRDTWERRNWLAAG